MRCWWHEMAKRPLSTVISQEPDLVILDVKMPEMDGYEVCGRIREFSSVPIIMLTALAQETDMIKGLSLGADDYVTKPFSIDVLMARVRAALRRVMLSEQGGHGSVFEHGELRIDFDRERVWSRGSRGLLTPLEYRLLCRVGPARGADLGARVPVGTRVGRGIRGRQCAAATGRSIACAARSSPIHAIPQYIQTRLGSGYVFVDRRTDAISRPAARARHALDRVWRAFCLFAAHGLAWTKL